MADPKETQPAPPPEALDEENLDLVVGGATTAPTSPRQEQAKKSDGAAP